MLYTRLINQIFTCMLFFAVMGISHAHNLHVGSYSVPPFSMQEDGENLGLAFEAISRILADANITDVEFEYFPLARGLVELGYNRIDVFFPFIIDGNVEQQEKQYILVGPISTFDIAYFYVANRDIDITTDNLSKYSIATVRGDISMELLQPYTTKIKDSSRTISCLNMVLAKRVDICATGLLPGMYVSAINGINYQFFYKTSKLYANMYIALSPQLAPEITTKIKDSYNKLNKAKFFKKNQKTYESKFDMFIESMTAN